MASHQRNSPSLNLITSSSPARAISSTPSPHYQSQSPFRYVQFHHQGPLDKDNEKSADSTLLSDSKHPLSSGRQHSPRSHTSANRSPTAPSSSPHRVPPLHGRPSPLLRQPATLIISNRPRALPTSYSRPRGLRITNLLRPWIPIILYALTSLGFVVAIAFFRTEVFTGLDHLSSWLLTDRLFGYAVLFFLIFLTTFPPVPLYSTLITLSGYTFGPWIGAIISYFAALSGALTVFILSRTLLRDTISRWLASTNTIKRVIYAIEKRPKLLFLIRLAPYPYNVMNCLLAAAPTLTLRTYTLCTALSLFKVIIHTSIGASIHSFREYHTVAPEDGSAAHRDGTADAAARTWTVVGVVLCVVVFVYLFIVARRAVDQELNDGGESEETIAFLSPTERSMAESPFRTAAMRPGGLPSSHA